MKAKAKAAPVVLELPRLRPDQYAIASHPAKFKICTMGRRWGKTTMAGDICMIAAAQGGRVGWVVPTYRNGRAIWRWIEGITAPLRKAGIAEINRSERTMHLKNGGFFGLYTAENEDGIRSEAFHLIAIDEAARISPTAWTDAIMPTLADYDGDAILFSTPRGKNWFYYEWLKGQGGNPDYASFKAPSSDNPSPQIQKAFYRAKDTQTERTFRQEWLAEFIDSGGEVFRGVQGVIVPDSKAYHDEPAYPGRFVFGIDTAQKDDYTVIFAIDTESRRVVDMDRFHLMEWQTYHHRILTLYQKWQPGAIMFEVNSAGQQFEMLQRAGLPITGFTTTGTSKSPLIESLALAIERRELMLHDDPVLISELMAYERTVNPTTNRSTYSAPAGMHDDCVMALALAWHAVMFGMVPAVSFA